MIIDHKGAFMQVREMEAIADTVAADLRQAVTGEGAVVVAHIARAAVMRAFGCTCRSHSDPGAVYVEDVMCRLHPKTGKWSCVYGCTFEGGPAEHHRHMHGPLPTG